MSWMRHPLYVWSDGENVNVGVADYGAPIVSFPESQLEDLAVMVAAELLEEGRLQEVAERSADRHSGNAGCDALDKLLGRRQGFADVLRDLVAK